MGGAEASLSERYPVRESSLEAAKRLAEACDIGVSAAQILVQRGLSEPEETRKFLNPSLGELSDPLRLLGCDAAVERLASAIRASEKIVVFGDYDVDGTTSAAILSEVLEALGAEVDVLVANRFAGGYGLSDQALESCLALNPKVLVTCDCGSSDHDRIERATRQDIDVIVIDHHLVPEESLPALVFLNPKQPGCGEVYRELTSAGLAFLVGAALRTRLNSKLDMRDWLDLVALGTVADVAPLVGDNRTLVRAGLLRLASHRARPGVRVLRELGKIAAGSWISATDIAFRFAPRINAAGRLGDAAITLDLLRAKSDADARVLGQKIDALNMQRKALEQDATREAIQQVRQVYGDLPCGGIVAASEDWHRGIVGISAARLVERFQCPVIVCGIEAGVAHGSARTPEGFDLHGALAGFSERLLSWGGHRAAAGLSFKQSELGAIREAFGDASRAFKANEKGGWVDIELSESFPLPSLQDLTLLEPLGEANPVPLFALEGEVLKAKSVGQGEHLSLELDFAGTHLRGFAPQQGARAVQAGTSIRCIGQLQPDRWRGGQRLEILVREFEQA